VVTVLTPMSWIHLAKVLIPLTSEAAVHGTKLELKGTLFDEIPSSREAAPFLAIFRP
jgi:hypothetical protein